MFLGDQLLAWLVLALGAAMFAGNLLAVVRPPEQPGDETHLKRAPIGRGLVIAALGLIAAIWAVATLVSG